MDFQDALISIEKDFLAAIRREYRQVRLEMLAALNDLGANNPSLPGQLRIIMSAFKIQLAEINQRFLLRIRELLTVFREDVDFNHS